MRTEARIKMGYYPTPLPVVDNIRSFLRYPDENVNILDPCCGEGLALRKLAEGTGAATYGIEPDGYRAGQARETLDHVLPCGYEDAVISNSAFSCLFLNPPYDWDSGEEFSGNERKEKTFLRGTMKYVMPDGVLVYIVPQKRMTEDVAKLLAYRFDDFDCYRFPDDEYERFGQIVLFGKKQKRYSLGSESFDRLCGIPSEDLREVPRRDSPVYDLPPSPEVSIFRSTLIDEHELERELGNSPLWERLSENGGKNNNHTGQPPLPLHTGHLGLLLASGCLDGVVGEGEDKHIVRGKVEKVTYNEQEYHGDVIIDFFFQAEDGIRDSVASRGLGDVYKRQVYETLRNTWAVPVIPEWSGWLYRNLCREGILEELHGNRKVVRFSADEEQLDEMISGGLQNGEISF